MAKEEINPKVTLIKQILEKNSLIIGTEKTIKALKRGLVQKVFLSSNCPNDLVDDILYYASFSDVEVIKLDFPNVEFGTICRKPFAISVASELKME